MSSSLPRWFNGNTVVVERQQLEAILDRLPPPVEMRCETILREARFDVIYVRRSNHMRFALTDYDWPYVIEALDLPIRTMLDETPKVRIRSFPVGWSWYRADVEIWVPARGPHDHDHWESFSWLRAWSWSRERAERRALKRWRDHEEGKRRAAEEEHITPVRGATDG